ncbi:MAG: hypothetical protein U0Q18_29610 [Bryobacteraceae bacterium]
MATTTIAAPAQNPAPAPALMLTVPSDPVSAAAFAAANLFVFLCTPAGQKIAVDAQAAGKALGDAVRTLAQDVVGIFRGIHA